MKKIMIYAKRRRPGRAAAPLLKPNADAVLFYSVFVCGSLIGCALFFSVDGNNVFSAAAAKAVEYGSMSSLLLKTAICVLFMITGITGGTGAAGIVHLLFLPLISSAAYAMIACRMISDAPDGFGRFALTVLPGGILFSAALIGFCTQSAAISKQTAAAVFFGRNEEIDGKRYLIRCALFFGVMLLGAIVDHAAQLLFGGAF